jgi:hypothetical protein
VENAATLLELTLGIADGVPGLLGGAALYLLSVNGFSCGLSVTGFIGLAVPIVAILRGLDELMPLMGFIMGLVLDAN